MNCKSNFCRKKLKSINYREAEILLYNAHFITQLGQISLMRITVKL